MGINVWDKVIINTESGPATAIAPVIISASRATDIPAFHAKWFQRRLAKGYCAWINPFNQKLQYVSFEQTKVIVFWTKYPKPLIPYLPSIESQGFGYYFHFTLNDYENEKLEPGLPPLTDRLAAFIDLSKRIGKEKIIWRFDPLLVSDTINIKTLLKKIAAIGDKIYKYTDKLVISFVDINNYAKVKRKLIYSDNKYHELTGKNIEEIASGLKKLNQHWGLRIASCAENFDLSRFGIVHNKCIDDALIYKLFGKDQKVSNFLIKHGNLKDKGQRSGCNCIISKDIGQYNSCFYNCAYCYAGSIRKTAKNARFLDEGETIAPTGFNSPAH